VLDVHSGENVTSNRIPDVPVELMDHDPVIPREAWSPTDIAMQDQSVEDVKEEGKFFVVPQGLDVD